VPIELQLGDGSVIKGATLEEAFENLAKAKEQTNTLSVPQPRHCRSTKFDRDGNRVK